MMFMDLTIRMVIVYAMPEAAKGAAIQATTEALEQGRLNHRIAHTVALEDIAHAHELIENGGFGGCVVLQIP
jgi:NADPH2:quinone reductase